MKRCDKRARKGTGEGICDRPLDRYGQCDRAANHIDSDEPPITAAQTALCRHCGKPIRRRADQDWWEEDADGLARCVELPASDIGGTRSVLGHEPMPPGLGGAATPIERDIDELIEASSLGTPGAKALRASVDPAHAAHLVAMSRAIAARTAAFEELARHFERPPDGAPVAPGLSADLARAIRRYAAEHRDPPREYPYR